MKKEKRGGASTSSEERSSLFESSSGGGRGEARHEPTNPRYMIALAGSRARCLLEGPPALAVGPVTTGRSAIVPFRSLSVLISGSPHGNCLCLSSAV